MFIVFEMRNLALKAAAVYGDNTHLHALTIRKEMESVLGKDNLLEEFVPNINHPENDCIALSYVEPLTIFSFSFDAFS